MPTVYFFKEYQINSDEWPTSKRPATLEAIAKLGGRPLMDSAVDVEPSDIDHDGFRKDDPRRV